VSISCGVVSLSCFDGTGSTPESIGFAPLGESLYIFGGEDL